MTREPSTAATVAVRLARAYPSLSVYSACVLADDLCRIERAQQRHAVRMCNGPAEARGDVPGYYKLRKLPMGALLAEPPVARWEHDPDAEERAGARIRRQVGDWMARLRDFAFEGSWTADDVPKIELEHDPRGCVLRLRLPGDVEAVPV